MANGATIVIRRKKYGIGDIYPNIINLENKINL